MKRTTGTSHPGTPHKSSPPAPSRLADDPAFAARTGLDLGAAQARVGAEVDAALPELRRRVLAEAAAGQAPRFDPQAAGGALGAKAAGVLGLVVAGVVAGVLVVTAGEGAVERGAVAEREAEAESVAVANREAEAERVAVTEAEVVAEAEAVAVAETEAVAEAEAVAVAEPEAVVEAERVAVAEPEAEADEEKATAARARRTVGSKPPVVEAPAADEPAEQVPASDEPEAVEAPAPESSLAAELAAYEAAEAALKAGEHGAAVAGFEGYLARWPRGALWREATLSRLEALVRARRLEEAERVVRSLREGADFASRRAELSRLHGDVLVKLGRCDEARAALEAGGVAGSARDAALSRCAPR